jgi:hypothetical protein
MSEEICKCGHPLSSHPGGCAECTCPAWEPTPGAIDEGAVIVPQKRTNPNVSEKLIEQAGNWNQPDAELK